MALLEYRNTPTVGLGSSPAQRLLARRTRSAFPVRDTQLHYAPQNQMWEKKVQRQQSIQSKLSAKGRDLPPLRVGQPVLVQDVHAKKTEWRRGLCQGQLSNRSYVVDVDGQPLHRNRRFLKPTTVGPTQQEENVRQEENVQQEENEGEVKTPEKEVLKKTPEKEVLKAQQHVPVQLECPEPVQKEPGNSSHGTVTQAAFNYSQVDATTTEESFRVPDERTSSTPPSKGSKPVSKTTTTTTRYGRAVRKPSRFTDYVQM